MVITKIDIRGIEKMNVYVDNAIDTYFITLDTGKGVIYFETQNLEDFKKLARKINAAVQFYCELAQREEAAI